MSGFIRRNSLFHQRDSLNAGCKVNCAIFASSVLCYNTKELGYESLLSYVGNVIQPLYSRMEFTDDSFVRQIPFDFTLSALGACSMSNVYSKR